MKPFQRIRIKGAGNKVTFNSLRFLLVPLVIVFCYVTLLVSPVLAVPTIISSPLPTGQVNASYIATLTAVPLSPPATWSVVSGALPTGISLDPSSGTISGIPTVSGTFTIIVQVTDTTGTSAPASFFITINPRPFNITTASLPGGMEGTAYSTSLAATGGTTPYYWSLSNGSLPSGLLLSTTTGYISGSPKPGSAGSYSFTVTVTDNSVPQRTAQTNLSIYIEKGSFQPTVTIGTGLENGTTKVKVDNKTVGVLKAGETMTLTLDLGASATVTVDAIVQDPANDGIRYTANEDSQVVNELQPYATFNYSTEYKIDIVTSPSQITTINGSGWYGKDEAMNVSAKMEVQADAYNQFRFSHWVLPDNNSVSGETLNFVVTEPGIITAYYDTYYKLTIESQFGETEGGGFYKAGTEATWSVVKDEVPMSGLVGFFQGKYKAVNPNGTEIMDAPKTETVIWEADYTLPYILIPVVILIVILAIVGFYFLLRRQQPKPVAYPQQMPPMGAPIPPRPIPQQHTTVVMIENKKEQKQLPSSTKDQLIEKFAELTGIPLILNTSFNRQEPIVERPEEAISCYLRTHMDVLVLGDFYISNRKPPPR